MLDPCRQVAGKRAHFSNHKKSHYFYDTYDAYDIMKTKYFLFLRSLKHFYDGVFIWIIRNISDTDIKIMFYDRYDPCDSSENQVSSYKFSLPPWIFTSAVGFQTFAVSSKNVCRGFSKLLPWVFKTFSVGFQTFAEGFQNFCRDF